MDYFKELGCRIGAQWKSGDSDEKFAQISTDILKDSPPPEPIDTAYMLSWANASPPDSQDRQHNTGFGEPPILVYDGDGFYLEVLFWFSSRTAIHGHGFTGAFRVLAGHSLQFEYDFETKEVIGNGIRSGELMLRNLQLIAPDDVSPILPENQFIHCVAHLGQPSITLVARTLSAENVTQYSYTRSGLAWLPFHNKEHLSQRIALAGAIKKTTPSLYEPALLEIARSSDPHGCFMTLEQLSRIEEDRALLERVAQAGCTTPTHRQHMLSAIDEMRRQHSIWNAIKNFPQAMRLDIALGELLGSKESTNQEIIRYFPDQPAEATLANWKKEITL